MSGTFFGTGLPHAEPDRLTASLLGTLGASRPGGRFAPTVDGLGVV